jgi:hypothetical protein
MRVVLVGCGFLGSLFAEELIKKLHSMEHPADLLFVDNDTVDQRNPSNHLYDPDCIGKYKADILVFKAGLYGFKADASKRYLTMDDLPEALKTADLVVDAVDNIPTRQVLWALGRSRVGEAVPILHLGLSQNGAGAVEWTTPYFDNFSLSPVALAGKEEEEVAKMGKMEKLRPCELNEHRGVGLNIAIAGVKSVSAYLGLEGHQGLQSWLVNSEGHTKTEETDVQEI